MYITLIYWCVQRNKGGGCVNESLFGPLLLFYVFTCGTVCATVIIYIMGRYNLYR